MTPPENTVPVGYAQVTDSNSQAGNDAGEEHPAVPLGEGNDHENSLGNGPPLGYAQVTDSDSQPGNDAGEQPSPATLGEGHGYYNFVGNSILQFLGKEPQPQQDLVTRLASQPPSPTPSPYPSVGGPAPAARDDGCQYPEPPQSSDELYTPCRGNGPSFAHRNEAASIDDSNEPPPRSALVSDNDPVLAPEPSSEDCLSRIDPSLL